MSQGSSDDPTISARLLGVVWICAALALISVLIKFVLAPHAMVLGGVIALGLIGFVIGQNATDAPAERLSHVRSMLWLLPLVLPAGVVVGLVAEGPFHMDEWGVWMDALAAYGPLSVMVWATFVACLALGHRRALNARQVE